MINNERIQAMENRLTEALSPSHIEIHNESHKHVGHAGAKTGRGHFKLIIASPMFDGKSRIQCHRMVYDALGEMMETDIHALTIEIGL